MSDVYLTGSSGFLGRNLQRLLRERGDYRIVTVGRRDRDHTYESLELSARSLQGSLIHLAGIAHDLKGSVGDRSYDEVNVNLTDRVFRTFLESDLSLMIFISSVKAVAEDSTVPLRENHAPRPSSPYGRSKLSAERILGSVTLPENKRVVILRPAMIHGPGNKGNLNLLFEVVRLGLPYPFAAFTNARSFASVDNVCFVIDQILRGQLASGTYNVADDEPLSTNRVVEVLSGALGRPVLMWKIPRFVMQQAARLGGIARLPINPASLEKLTGNFVVSNVRLKTGLGIERLPVSAEEGLRLTAEAWAGARSG